MPTSGRRRSAGARKGRLCWRPAADKHAQQAQGQRLGQAGRCICAMACSCWMWSVKHMVLSYLYHMSCFKSTMSMNQGANLEHALHCSHAACGECMRPGIMTDMHCPL